MRIIFYYNHQEDIGHLMRLRTIIGSINKIKRPDTEIFVINAGKKQGFVELLKPENIFYVPNPFYSKDNIGKATFIRPACLKTRIKFIKSVIDLIKPELFITEFFPFGRNECKYELLPILQYLYQMGIRIYSSVPIPYFTFLDKKLAEFIKFCRLYDKILIHSPEDIDLKYISKFIHLEKRISKQDFLMVFRLLKKKIDYTGYVIPDSLKNPEEHSEHKMSIVAHRGGGTTSPNIISTVLLSAYLLKDKYKILCVAGPATSIDEYKKFKNILRHNAGKGFVSLKKFVPDLGSYFKKSHLCIGTGGSSVYELLYLKKRSVIIPYMGSLNRVRIDQLARANILKDYAGARVIHYNDLSQKRLLYEINSLEPNMEIKVKRIDEKWFMGADYTAKSILC